MKIKSLISHPILSFLNLPVRDFQSATRNSLYSADLYIKNVEVQGLDAIVLKKVISREIRNKLVPRCLY